MSDEQKEFAARLRALLQKEDTLEEAVEGFLNGERFTEMVDSRDVKRLRAALERRKAGK